MDDFISVGELKAKLESMPDDALVATRQYRHGQDTVTVRYLTKNEAVVLDQLFMRNQDVKTVVI